MVLTDPNEMDPNAPVDPGEPAPAPRRRQRQQQQQPGSQAPQQCPAGQQMINGRCRHAGDFPCPEGQCKDKVTGQCRSFNPRREKANETDDIERASGGGRGFCKMRERPGAADGGPAMGAGAGGFAGAGAGGGGGSSAGAEDQYFQRLVNAGDWTEWPPGSGQYFNDPNNDPSRRVWVDRRNLQVEGTGYRSTHDPTRGPSVNYSQIPAGTTVAQYLSGNSPGGPGGGPGPSPGGPGAPGAPAGGGSIQDQIQNQIQSILGGQTRFNDRVMADITSGAKGMQQAEVASGTEALDEDLARRGLSNSAAGASLAQGVRSEAAGRFDATLRETRVKKAFYDFEDKLEGLKQAQQYLAEMHDYELGLEANDIRREEIAASLALGRERIAAESRNLLAQIAANSDLASMQIGSTEFMFMQRQLMCLQNPASC
jgi:hypothetical protein